MDIQVSRSGQVTVLVPKGDLDVAAADVIKRTLTELINEGQTKLVMDLGDVPYIDSSGLHSLVVGMKRARSAGGDIKLCALQADVRAIFEMTRLIKSMDVYPTRQEAVASWA